MRDKNTDRQCENKHNYVARSNQNVPFLHHVHKQKRAKTPIKNS